MKNRVYLMLGEVVSTVLLVKNVFCQEVAQRNVNIRMKLSTEETLFIDLLPFGREVGRMRVEEQVLTNYGNNIEVTTTEVNGTNITMGMIVAANNTNLSWIYQDYFYYSVSENDCLGQGQISPYLNSLPVIERRLYEDEAWTKGYPYNLTTQQILSRQFKFTYKNMFITTCYFQVPDDLFNTSSYINLMETKKLSYDKEFMKGNQIVDGSGCNRTNYWLYRPDIINDYGASVGLELPSITCFSGYYMLIYDETVYLCSSQANGTDIHIYFFRSGIQKYYRIGTLPADYAIAYVFENPLGDVSAIIQPTFDDSFELLFFIYKKPDLFIVNFNRNEVISIQSYKLDFRIMGIDYVKKTLMILRKEEGIQSISFYLRRNPGESFYPGKLSLLGDVVYLNSLYSNENIEIILEMYLAKNQNNNAGADKKRGFVPCVVHLLYTFDLIENKMKLSASNTFCCALQDEYEGIIYRIDSFSSTDMVILMAHLQIRLAGTSWIVDRNSVEFAMGGISGLHATNKTNPHYKVYPSATIFDPWTEHYFMLPYKNLLGPLRKINQAETRKICDLLRVRVNRPHLKIKYNILRPQNYTLMIQDEQRASQFKFSTNTLTIPNTVYSLNFTFHNDSDPFFSSKSIWEGSNLTTFQLDINLEKQFIALDSLVRGNFIIRVNSQPDLANLLHFPYYSASMEDANKVLNSSLYLIDNYRIFDINEFYLVDIQSIKAFGVTENNIISRKLIIIKTIQDKNMLVYTIPSNQRYMLPAPSLPIRSNILKIFTIKENTYIFFDDEGFLSLFDALNVVLIPLSFSGVPCLDLEVLTHNRIKPAFICFNVNFQFTIYYIDSIITQSLLNSYQNIEMRKTNDNLLPPSLNHKSKIMVSEFYMGKLFIYHPDAKKDQPNLSVYYLDLEEQPVLYFIKSENIKYENSNEGGLTSKLQSLEFVEDRLVVHYQRNNLEDYIGVYKFNDTFDAMLTKIFNIPEKYKVIKNSQLTFFEKHFQSSLYPSPHKPYLLLPVEVGLEKYYNVLVIDPFGPISETIPTFLLPVHSSNLGSVSYLFEYYVASLNMSRYYSVGILHYLPNPARVFRDIKKMYYLFQLITADIPKIHFTFDRKDVISYEVQFQKPKSNLNLRLQFPFRSDLYPANYLNSTVEIYQKQMIKGNLISGDITPVIIKIALKDKLANGPSSWQHPKIILYEKNFTELPGASVTSLFDWKLESESIFDNMVGTFHLTTPLNLVKTLYNRNVSTVVNIDTFCRAYKLNNGELQCTKKGWIFFHTEEIEVFYTSHLEDISSAKSVRFPFNVNECTEGVVVNHTLISVCTYDNLRSKILTNLIDLSQSYETINLIDIWPKTTKVSISKTYEQAGVTFINEMVNDYNVKGIDSMYFFLYDQKVALNPKKSCVPHVTSTLRHPFQKKQRLHSAFFSIGRLKKYTVIDSTNTSLTYESSSMLYKVSASLISEGWIGCLFIGEDGYYVGPTNISTKTLVASGSWLVFTNSQKTYTVLRIGASEEIIKLIFEDLSNSNVVFNPNDGIAENDFTELRFSLIHFPSYHSYLCRYIGTSESVNMTILKLENPFALVKNKKGNIKPICHSWACIIISTFGDDRNFIKVYDMKYEQLTSPAIPPNIKKVFPNMDWSTDSKILDLDLIGSEYTIYPIQVLNTSNLQLLSFDPEKSNEEYLVIVCLYKDNRMEFYNLSRKARITTNNLYLMSNFVDMNVRLSQDRSLWYRFELDAYREEDWYKYLIQALIIGGFGLVMICFMYKHMRAAQRDAQRECEDYLTRELEERRNTLEKIKAIVLKEQYSKIDFSHSLLENRTRVEIRRNALIDPIEPTELVQWRQSSFVDIQPDDDDFYE